MELLLEQPTEQELAPGSVPRERAGQEFQRGASRYWESS